MKRSKTLIRVESKNGVMTRQTNRYDKNYIVIILLRGIILRMVCGFVFVNSISNISMRITSNMWAYAHVHCYYYYHYYYYQYYQYYYNYHYYYHGYYYYCICTHVKKTN